MKRHFVTASNFKRTKILATIGPASADQETVNELLENGANGIRLNFSHGTHEEKKMQVGLVRKASKTVGKPVAIVQDLQGPKIRLGDFDKKLEFKAGDKFSLKYRSKYPQETHIPIQYDISKKVRVGHRILINDGHVVSRVVSVRGDIVTLRVESGGSISSRKGVNLPETDFSGDIITAKDEKDIAFGAKLDVDYVALSFVQTAKDIQHLRALLDEHGSNARIIAKIEASKAVENLEKIIMEADAVMVARGDLALEIPSEAVPIVQRETVNLAMKHKKISIVATQMLASMTESPDPSRAEVSDVANAVLMGADTVMLSDETASGKHPIQAVKMMRRIILYSQKHTKPIEVLHPPADNMIQDSIAAAIIYLAREVRAAAIVAETKSGSTALAIAARRPNIPIAIITSDAKVQRQLALIYGGKSRLHKVSKHATKRTTGFLLEEKMFKKGDIIVSANGSQAGISGLTDTIKVRVL